MHDAPRGMIRDGVRRLFRLAVRRAEERDREIDEELTLHLEARVAQLMGQGLSPDAARAEAIRRLGSSVADTREQLRRIDERQEQRVAWRERLENLIADTRYAARGLVQRKGFTITAVLTLAIGIGANSAIFSAVDALLLRALPFPDPQTLVDIVQLSPSDPAHGGSSEEPWSYPKFLTFQESQKSFGSLALDARENFILPGENSERVIGERVSAKFLRTLGVPVSLGRDFAPEIDTHADAPKQVIISTSLWQRKFGARPDVVGQVMRVDSSSFTIIGVVPARFRGLSGRAELFVPVTTRTADDLNAWGFEFAMIGRLTPETTVAQADADARRVAPIVYKASPETENSLSSGPGGAWSAKARGLDSVRVASSLRRSLLILFGAVALVLLLACANLANLLLGRAAARRQEIAVRLAIGAGRARLVQLLLCESVMLATAGGVASLLVGAWGARFLRAANPEETLQVQGLTGSVGAVGFEHVALDARALLFTLAVTVIVAVMFGLVPALQSTRVDLTSSLRGGSSRTGNRLGGTRRSLVIAEVALAMVLLAGSVLMVRSLSNILAIDPGFDSRQLLTLRLNVRSGSVTKDSMPGFYTTVQSALRGLPGVQEVSLIDCPPLNGGCNGTLMTFPDRPATSTGNAMVGVHWATPSWFSSTHVLLKRGRMFSDADRTGAPRVVLINETAARKYWPGEDPLGKPVKVYQGGFHEGATVVGIVSDVRFGTVDSAAIPDVFISYAQAYTPRMMIFLRTTGDPLAVVGSVRRALREVAPDDPIYDVATMSDRVGAATAQARFSATLLTLFGAVALGLAIIGIYGVMTFGVVQRTREIGIRTALGAGRGQVQRMVVREGMILAAIGAAVGLVAAVALSRLMRTLLYGVQPEDPVTYAVIAAIVGVAALIASWIPARRASRIEPTEALRRG